MTATLSTDTGIAGMIGNYYDHVFLERLEANLCYDKYGEQRPLPENQGNTVVWHRLNNPVVGTVLTEGATPTASVVSATKVSASLLFYADLRSISDQVAATAVCPVVEETVQALGYGAALTKDSIIANLIGFGSATSTGVTNAASATYPSVYSQGFPILEGNLNTAFWPDTSARATPLTAGYFSTIPTIAHIREAVTVLKTLNAIPFESNLYKGVVHPLVSDLIRRDSTFPTWMAYSNLQAMTKGKLGVIERVDFEESSNALWSVVTASAWSTGYTSGGGSIFGTLIFGKGAYGVTKLGAKDAKINIVTGADKTDPLNQVTLVGYKLAMSAKILNPSAGVILGYFKQLAP
jgi:N4-gp56 family major capsid protein